MLRYLRLYASFVRFSFSRALEFRLDFFFRVVMDAAFYGVHLAFFGVLFGQTDLLGGWNWDQVLIFAAAYFVVDALHMTIFSNNAWQLPILINQGDLDYYLVRPVSPLFFLSLRDFAANSFLNLVLAAGLLTWALLRYPAPLPAQNVGVFLLLLGAGTFLHYVLYMLFLSTVFWTHSAQGVQEFFFGIQAFSERPHGIYQGWLRRVLLTVLPLCLIASVPTQVLFEGPRLAILLHMAIVVSGMFALLCFVWRRGLRAYASASS